MVFHVQLLERFKTDKRSCGFEQSGMESDTELCKNDAHVIAKMYKLLKFEKEEE